MGKLVFLFFALVFLFGILNNSGIKRLIWFFTGILFFSDRIMLFDMPTKMSFDRFLIYVLVLSELLKPKEFLAELKCFPLIKSILLFFIGILCVGVFDERIGIFLKLYRPFDYFIQTTFVTFLCYLNLKDTHEWIKFIKFLLLSSLLLSIYGLYNFFTKSNPIDNLITTLYNSVSPFDDYLQGSGRFRVNSFVSHPIYYGYLCGIFLILSFYGFYFSKELKKISLISMPLLIINLILANSRTPLFAFAIGLLVFIVLAFKLMDKIKIVYLVTIMCFLIYNVPMVKERTESVVDIFKTGGGKTSGSSLDMRTMQLLASYSEFLNKPIFGHGLYYIEEDMGWANIEEERTSDSDFQGFESYIYQLLIEQGLVGILTTIIIVLSIAIYYIKKRRISKEISALGLSILVMFLLFIIGTGTLHSWIISMGLIGISIKYLELKQKEV
jgi:hypothetical protein